MKIYGIEKLSLVDYDGYVAATVFTGGCNFKCPFCHNAPLVADYKEIAVIEESEVLDYLKKRKGVIEGLCITGGEPTLNNDLPTFCEKVKNLDILVKVDSNGTNPNMLKTLYNNKLADYFAIDIKNDKKNYSKIIGYDTFDTTKVEKTVDFLINSKANYEFRTTVINEFHEESNIKAIGEWIEGAKKYFLQKFKSGDNCLSPEGLSPVPDKIAHSFLEIVKPYVKEVSLRGYDITTNNVKT